MKSLEILLNQDINNQEIWLVYGDWLQVQGDIRGELIALDYALLEQQNNQDYQAKINAIYQENKHLWLGNILAYLLENQRNLLVEHYINQRGSISCDIELEWLHGFIKAFRLLPRIDRDINFSAVFMEDVLLALLENENTKFLQEVAINIKFNIKEKINFHKIFASKLTCVAAKELKIDLSRLQNFKIPSLTILFPYLTKLKIHAEQMHIEQFQHGKLESLELAKGILVTNGPVDLPNLKDFFLVHDKFSNPEMAWLEEFLIKAYLPSLQRMWFRVYYHPDFLEKIIYTSAFKKIKILGLNFLEVDSYTFFHQLKTYASAFDHLETLHLIPSNIEGYEDKVQGLFGSKVPIKRRAIY